MFCTSKVLALTASGLCCLTAAVATQRSDQARFRVELRRAERTPTQGLIEAISEDTGEKVYLYNGPIITEKDILKAQIVQSYRPDQFEIEMTLTSDGGEKLARITGEHIGRPIAILVDGKVISAPTVNSKVYDQVRIAGSFTKEKAEAISEKIRSVLAGSGGPVTLTLVPDISSPITTDSLDKATTVLQKRLGAVPHVRARLIKDGTKLKIEVPSADDLVYVGRLVSEVGSVTVFGSQTQWSIGAEVPDSITTLLTNLDIARVEAVHRPKFNTWQVMLVLTAQGSKRIEEYHRANVGAYLVTAKDRAVVDVAWIISKPSGPEPELMLMEATEEVAKLIVAQLNNGMLPCKFKVVKE